MSQVNYNFHEAMARLKDVSGLATQLTLAPWLGVTQSALSCAGKRRSIPAQWLLVILKKTGVNPEWILHGDPCPKFLEPRGESREDRAA